MAIKEQYIRAFLGRNSNLELTQTFIGLFRSKFELRVSCPSLAGRSRKAWENIVRLPSGSTIARLKGGLNESFGARRANLRPG